MINPEKLSALLKFIEEGGQLVGFRAWLEVRDPKTGRLLLKTPNKIVDAGLAVAAYQLMNGGTSLVHSCVGTGTTAADHEDTNLETGVDSVDATRSRVTTAVANDTAQFVSLHTAPGGGWAITEFGMKTEAGTLFNRVVFSAINLAEGNQLEFTYKVQCVEAV